MIMNIKQRKIQIEPKTKLNYNEGPQATILDKQHLQIYVHVHFTMYIVK